MKKHVRTHQGQHSLCSRENSNYFCHHSSSFSLGREEEAYYSLSESGDSAWDSDNSFSSTEKSYEFLSQSQIISSSALYPNHSLGCSSVHGSLRSSSE